MRYRSALLLAVLLLAALAPIAGAGEPTEQLKTDIDELYRSANTAGGGTTAARPIVDRMFDWTAMAESSLRGHWTKRTPAERAEFTKLFSDLFARAYLSRIHLVDARQFQYLGDTTNGEQSTVKTKVFTKRGSALDVDYLVQASPSNRWLVRDVKVEGISLMDNYRVQFDTIIAKSSYQDLVTRLKNAGK
jgi:phospholipid transport system substrate-binding protein